MVYLVFNIFFICECLLKIFVLGFVHYLNNDWNKFDFFIVLTSVIDIVTLILSLDKKNFESILKILKLFRVARMLKLIKSV